MNPTLIAVSAVYGVVSVVTFVTYAIDKRAARRGARRVSERTLHTLALFGGWPGALIARATFRHKSRKRGFTFVLLAIVAIHVAAWILIWKW